MPVATVDATVNVAVDVPDPGAVIDVGMKETVTPDGCPDDESETALLKPPETVVEIVEAPDEPWTTGTETGDAEIAKSEVLNTAKTRSS